MIVRYFEWGIFNPDNAFPVWEEISTIDDLYLSIPISREDALKRIKENGFKLVYTCDHGQVYDTPDEEFKSSVKGSRLPTFG